MLMEGAESFRHIESNRHNWGVSDMADRSRLTKASAFVTGEAELLIDPRDPFAEGIAP